MEKREREMKERLKNTSQPSNNTGDKFLKK